MEEAKKNNEVPQHFLRVWKFRLGKKKKKEGAK